VSTDLGHASLNGRIRRCIEIRANDRHLLGVELQDTTGFEWIRDFFYPNGLGVAAARSVARHDPLGIKCSAHQRLRNDEFSSKAGGWSRPFA
jgi:hypothetical protein